MTLIFLNLPSFLQLSQVVDAKTSQDNNAEQLGSAIVTGQTKDKIPSDTTNSGMSGNSLGANL